MAVERLLNGVDLKIPELGFYQTRALTAQEDRSVSSRVTIKSGPLREVGGLSGLNEKLLKVLHPIVQARPVRDVLSTPPMRLDPLRLTRGILGIAVGLGLARVSPDSLMQLSEDGEWTAIPAQVLMRPSPTHKPGIQVRASNRINGPPVTTELVEENGRAVLSCPWYTRLGGLVEAISEPDNPAPGNPEVLIKFLGTRVVKPGPNKQQKTRKRVLEVLAHNPTFPAQVMAYAHAVLMKRSLDLELWYIIPYEAYKGKSQGFLEIKLLGVQFPRVPITALF